MWLFNSVSCAPQSRHRQQGKNGSECLLAWLQKWIHQPRTGSITVSLRLQLPLSLRADEAEGRSRDFLSSWSFSLPLALLLCVSSERDGRRQSVLVGCFYKVAGWMTIGEAPGLFCPNIRCECCDLVGALQWRNGSFHLSNFLIP